jgi:hypothetical protein
VVVSEKRGMVARDEVYSRKLGRRDTFEHDFRMKRQTFHLLLEILKPYISANDRMEGVRASVDAETRLAVALFWYASGSTQRHIGDLFGISRQSVAKFCNIVSRAIVEHLVPLQILFPKSVFRTTSSCCGFQMSFLKL